MAGDSLFALILMIAVLSGIGLFVIQPILRSKPENVLENFFEETPYHELLAKKNSLYQSLKDVEFDFKTAKLSEDDYIDLREKLEQEAVDVLKKIDYLESKSGEESLDSISKPAKKKALRCPECGETYTAGAKFCGNCGRQL